MYYSNRQNCKAVDSNDRLSDFRTELINFCGVRQKNKSIEKQAEEVRSLVIKTRKELKQKYEKQLKRLQATMATHDAHNGQEQVDCDSSSDTAIFEGINSENEIVAEANREYLKVMRDKLGCDTYLEETDGEIQFDGESNDINPATVYLEYMADNDKEIARRERSRKNASIQHSSREFMKLFIAVEVERDMLTECRDSYLGTDV